MELEELEIRIVGKIDDLERKIDDAKKLSRKAGEEIARSFATSADKIGRSLTRNVSIPLAAVGVGLAALGVKSFQAAAQLDTMERGLGALMGSAQAAQREIANLQRTSQLPGIDFKTALAGSQRLQAVGLAADKARSLMEGLANANARAGGSAENLDGTLIQLGQTLSSGRLQGDELRTISERIPEFRKVLSQQFGTSNSEIIGDMMTSGKLSMEAFVDGMIVGLKKLPQAEAGIQTSIKNLQNRVFVILADAGKDLIPVVESVMPDLEAALKDLVPVMKDLIVLSKDMVPNIKLVVSAIADVARAFSALSPSVQGAIVKATVFSVALGPMLTGLSGLVRGITVATSAMNSLKTAMALEAALMPASSGLTGLGAKFAQLTGAVSKYGAVARLLPFLTNPITLTAAAATAAIVGLRYAYKHVSEEGERYAKELKRVIDAQGEADKSAFKTASAVNDLAGEIKNLQNKTTPTKEETSRLQDALNELSKIAPGLITGYDNQGNALGILAGAYKKAADEAERFAKANQITNSKVFSDQLGELAERRAFLREILEARQKVKFPSQDLKDDLAKRASEIADITRKMAELKVQMAGVFNPPVVPTPKPVVTNINKSDKLTEAQKQAEELRDQIYELNKEIALGAEATESMSLIYDRNHGKIKAVNVDLADQQIWLQTAKEQTDELTKATADNNAEIEKRNNTVADANKSASERLASLIQEKTLLSLVTEDEKKRFLAVQQWRKEMQSGVNPTLAALNLLIAEHNRALSEKHASAVHDFITAWKAGIERAKEIAKKTKEAGEDFAKAWNDGIKKGIENAKDATKRFDESMLGLRERFAAATSKTESFRLALEKLKESFGGGEKGAKRAQEYMDELFNVEKAEKWKEQMDAVAKSVEDAFMDMFDGLLNNGFNNFFDNVMTGFQRMLADIAREWLAMQMRMLIQRNVNSLLGNLFGAVAGGAGASGGGGGSSGDGYDGGWLGRAFGGPMMPDVPYLVHKDEVIVPRGMGATAIPGSRAGGMGVTNVTINVTTPDAESFRRSRTQIAREVSRMLPA